MTLTMTMIMMNMMTNMMMMMIMIMIMIRIMMMIMNFIIFSLSYSSAHVLGNRGDSLQHRVITSIYFFCRQTKVASSPGWSNTWNRYSEQRSERFSLKAGQAYYLQAHHVDIGGGDHVFIGVSMETTKHTNAKVGIARDENQKICTRSVVLRDIQVQFCNYVYIRFSVFSFQS